MPKVLEISTGKTFDLPSEAAQELLDHPSKDYSLSTGESLNVRNAEGLSADVSAVDVERVRDAGSTLETSEQAESREDDARITRENSGFLSGAATVAENFADTATLGGYGAATDAIFGDDYTTDRRERNQARENLALAGKVGGVVAPTLLSGGTGTAGALARMSPIGLAERAGQAIIRKGASKSLAKQYGSRALGYGAEGAIIGAGEGVQELALSEDPVTLERAMGVISSKALYGGGVGGGFGLAGKALEKGLGRAKGMLDDAAAARKGGGIAEDLAGMDKAGLAAAGRAATEEMGGGVVQSVRASLDDHSDSMFRGLVGGDKLVVTKTRSAGGWLVKHLDDPRGLAKNPDLVSKSLRLEEQVLRKTLDDQVGALAKLNKADDAIDAAIAGRITKYKKPVKLKGEEGALYGNLFGRNVKGKGAGAGVKLDKGDLEEFRALIGSGAAKKMRAEAMGALPKALDDNLALQATIDGIKNKTAPRLAEIQGALDGLSSGGKKAGLLEQTAQGSLFGAVTGAASFAGPLAPIVGAKVSGAITDVIFGRISKAGADASIRSAKALSAFLDASKKANRIAPPLASKTLTSIAFGAEPAKIANALAKKPKQGLAGAYKERERELRSITYRDEAGDMQMTPEARDRVAEQHVAVRGVDPIAADMMETTAARRVSFLASKLPKRPDLPALQLGPDNWRPSDMAIRQFARFVAAVEDPGQVEERLADGSITPEDAEAIRIVYPELFEDIKSRIIESLPELRENLPYERRLALSIFSGVAVDPAMDPRILRVLQSSFANEPGSEGGTQAPKAQAQFGSVSKPNPTAAQERAG